MRRGRRLPSTSIATNTACPTFWSATAATATAESNIRNITVMASGGRRASRRDRRIPYRLPELVGAPVTTVVYFCEGEKDAESLAKIGLVATTASEGANAPWAPELTPYFKDRRVVILPDADLIGRKHGSKIARALAPVAKSVKVVDLFPGCHDGSDVSDWLQTDTAGIKLIKAVNDAPLWDPASTERDTAGANKTSANDNAEIERLAKLPRNG